MEISLDSYDVNDSLQRAIQRVDEFRRTGQVYLLLYAAVDVRLCIEQTLFQYLVLIRSGNVPAKLERLYSATDLKKALLREEPQFFRKLEFLDLFAKFLPFMNDNPVVVAPDLDLLSQCYGRSNGYLHCPKRPDDTWRNIEWWAELEQSVNEVIPHLVRIHSGLIGAMKLNERGQLLFQQFVSGEMSREEVMGELERTFAQRPPVQA